MKNDIIRKCEKRCGLIIIMLGLTSYFAWDWLGMPVFLGAVFPVNRSVFEYCKPAFWPGVVVSLFEYGLIKRNTFNFAFAKMSMLLAAPFLMVLLYYTYSGILGFSLFAADMAVYIISVLTGQYISCRILLSKKNFHILNTVAPLILVLLLLAFSLPTFFPAEIAFFKDMPSGSYGMPVK